jgi:hypothetical protein
VRRRHDLGVESRHHGTRARSLAAGRLFDGNFARANGNLRHLHGALVLVARATMHGMRVGLSIRTLCLSCLRLA